MTSRVRFVTATNRYATGRPCGGRGRTTAMAARSPSRSANGLVRSSRTANTRVGPDRAGRRSTLLFAAALTSMGSRRRSAPLGRGPPRWGPTLRALRALRAPHRTPATEEAVATLKPAGARELTPGLCTTTQWVANRSPLPAPPRRRASATLRRASRALRVTP